MALEAVVLTQLRGSARFGCGAMAGGAWNGLFGGVEGAAMELGGGGWEAGAWCSSSMMLHGFQGMDHGHAARAPPVECAESTAGGFVQEAPAATAPAGRRKRRRTRAIKNREEAESQRMTHIAVERNRRRQMNEYLAALRSLMPPSYAHRGDQASIVGGAINYVRELEQLLQSLEAHKSIKNRAGRTDAGCQSPFAGFFSFPQYSTAPHSGCGATSAADGGPSSTSNVVNGVCPADAAGESCRPAAIADIEVTMVEGHASLKVLARRRPKQLLKLVAGLHQLRIPPLHLNMTTTVDAMVLYTFSLKVEDDSKMGSVEDIATAVHEILSSIQQQEETAVM